MKKGSPAVPAKNSLKYLSSSTLRSFLVFDASLIREVQFPLLLSEPLPTSIVDSVWCFADLPDSSTYNNCLNGGNDYFCLAIFSLAASFATTVGADKTQTVIY